MPTALDATLAQLSLAAYSDAPVELPAFHTALDPSNFGLPLAAGESFSNGVFKSGNGAALLSVGFANDQPAIFIAFRGSDDTTDSLQDLNGINAAYDSFGSLVAAVDQASAAWGVPVYVTGHSLGGAMAQLYMATHPDQPDQPGHAAVTFGSPGAVLPPGEDPRILNYVVADDPAVVLGAHRAGIGNVLRTNDALADAAADRIAGELPGLTREQALASLPNLTVNYDNRGDIILLPTDDGRLDYGGALAGLSELDGTRHEVQLYATEVAAAVATPAESRLVPATPGADQELLFLRALYDGDGRTPAETEAVLRDLTREWVEELGGDITDSANDVFTDIRDGLADIGRDLNLI